MKILNQKVSSFIKKIPIDIKVILLYGTDAGLIYYLSNKIKSSFLENNVSNDNLTKIDASDIIKEPNILHNAIYTSNMFSKIAKKIIIISSCTFSITKIISDTINSIDKETLLILLAEELTTSNSLRKLAENSSTIAAIACYHDNKDNLKNFIKTTLDANNYEITPEALDWLSENLGNDRLITQQEINKLILYKNNNLKIELLDVINVITNNSDLLLNDIVNFITLGKQVELYNLLNHTLLIFPAVVIVRSLTNNFKRLLFAKLIQQKSSMTIHEIAKNLKPPVLFMNIESFKTQLLLWDVSNIKLYLNKLIYLELSIKSDPNLSELFLKKLTLDIYLLLRKLNKFDKVI